ncbi:MAG: DMT family transporter [Actinomycetota bacterium]
MNTTPADDHERATSDPATLAAFLALVAIAGGNAPAIRYISCQSCELDPFWGAAMRFGLASALFAIVAVVMRVERPRGSALLSAVLYGVLQFGAGFGLIYWGLVRSPAGLGQVLVASVPLLTFGLALAHRQERFRLDGLLGAALAVGGIVVVFSNALDVGVPATSMLAILGGSVCWAEALVLVKRFPPVHPATMNAIGMGIGAVVLLVLTVMFDESYVIPSSASTVWAQVYLVLAGSLGVFWLHIVVLRRWTASATSYELVLIPLVTLPVSAWLHDEKITVAFAAGSVLVLLGVYIGAIRRPVAR